MIQPNNVSRKRPKPSSHSQQSSLTCFFQSTSTPCKSATATKSKTTTTPKEPSRPTRVFSRTTTATATIITTNKHENSLLSLPSSTSSSSSLYKIGDGGTPKRKKKIIHPETGSYFHKCPICQKEFPFHQLEFHASQCNNVNINIDNNNNKITNNNTIKNNFNTSLHQNKDNRKVMNVSIPNSSISENIGIDKNVPNESSNQIEKLSLLFHSNQDDNGDRGNIADNNVVSITKIIPPILDNNYNYIENDVDVSFKINNDIIVPTNTCIYTEPIPGLYVIDDFLTVDEEIMIMNELDGKTPYESLYIPWNKSNFNGTHNNKRWGVHCNLRDRKVTPPENPLPNFINNIVLPKIKSLLLNHDKNQLQIKFNNHCISLLSSWKPNEANAINYNRIDNNYLKAHVDDRQLSKELIVNISLLGNCYMTFINVRKHNNNPIKQIKVLLKRRCIQVLTGSSRYDYTHAIAHNDLLSNRRVSVTIRESPLSKGHNIAGFVKQQQQQQLSTHLLMKKTTPSLSSTPCLVPPIQTPTTDLSSSDPFIEISENTDMKSNQLTKTIMTNEQDTNIDDSNIVPWWKNRNKKLPSINVITPIDQRKNDNSMINIMTRPNLPGLYIIENFISIEEEQQLINEIDIHSPIWKKENHSGIHYEKRWGIDHDLWNQHLRQPIHHIPSIIQNIIFIKLQQQQKQLSFLHNIQINDINSICYEKNNGHSLTLHVDDRHKHKEPILNLSLCGDCYMTFQNMNHHKNRLSNDEQKVLLKQRTLMILTNKVRYDFAHGIYNHDLLSNRRISITMRQTSKEPPSKSPVITNNKE